jgi:hypothetical protein
MTCSYMERKVPKLIVRDIVWNIPRFYCDIKNMITLKIWSMDLLYRMQMPYPLDQPSFTNMSKSANVNDQTIFKIHLRIFRHISQNVEVWKNPKYFRKDNNT